MRHLCTLAFISALAGNVSGYQHGSLRAALRLDVDWLQPEYSDLHVRGQAMILVGEPLVVRIGVSSPWRDAPAAAERDWLANTEFKIVFGDRFNQGESVQHERTCVSEPIRDSDAVKVGDETVTLSPGSSQWLVCSITSPVLQAQPGPYTLVVNWRADAPTTFRLLPASAEAVMLQVEVRSLQTEGDLIDRDLHLGTRALREGRVEVAEGLADAVLKRIPQSVSAHVLRGRARASRQCRLAASDFREAAALIDARADTRSRHLSKLKRTELDAIAAEWLRLANSLKC